MKNLYEKNKAAFITVTIFIVLLIVVGVVLLIQYLHKEKETTRGTGKSKGGENNPMNIRATSIKWLGEVDPGFQTSFENFRSPADGYRAAFVIIYNYIKNGKNTIREILNKYAPPSENPTDAYIKYVSDRTGIKPDYELTTKDMTGSNSLGYRIITAMSRFEQGVEPVMSDITKGDYLFHTTYLS